MMRTIFKFYKANKEICHIGIVALVISLSYACTYYMPDYLGIEPFYSFFNNLSISYIAAMFFYVVQVYIPEERNKKKSMEVLKNNFAELTQFVDYAILMCDKHIKIKEKGATILWNDEGEQIFLNYKKVNSDEKPCMKKYNKFELLDWDNQFTKKISRIKETAVINYCDYEVLQELSELEKVHFFSELNCVIKYADTDLNFQSFVHKLDRIREVNNKLKELCLVTQQYQLVEVCEKDKKKMKMTLKYLEKNGMNINIDEMNKFIFKEELREKINADGILIAEDVLESICEQCLNGQKTNNGN